MQVTLGAVICFITWHLCQGSPLISLWETNCKIHADSKHDELKGILNDHHRFNSNNWSHSILVIITIMISCILIFGCCFVYYKLGPLCMFTNKLLNLNQMAPQKYHHQQFNPPYNITPINCRTLQFKEITPNTQINETN